MAAYSLKETNYSISNFYQNTAKFPVGVEGEVLTAREIVQSANTFNF